MTTVENSFEADETLEKTIGDNGQIYLGKNLAGMTVKVGYTVVEE